MGVPDMSERLCILVCHNFRAEVAAAIAAEAWDDVCCAEFPARCGRPATTWDSLRDLLPANCTQLLILGRACTCALGEVPPDFPPTQILDLQQCFHLMAGQHLVRELMDGGAYLMNPTWLADWRGQLRRLGFEPDQASAFFSEFARELVLLDTGCDPDAASHLQELHAQLQLPVRRIAVGLDHMRLTLARHVVQWRHERERREAQTAAQNSAREIADGVAAMDLLTRVANTQDEPQTIGAIEDLFRMLFAPEVLHYCRVEHGVFIAQRAIPDDLLDAMRALDSAFLALPGGRGFLLRIAKGDVVLGVVGIDGLAFAHHLRRYLNLALTVVPVCALAIENARNRHRLLAADKMAALGVLVAGVAHEINTPLGVALTASSTLQREGQALRQRFDERSMTHADLQRHLKIETSGVDLIQSSLQRIGQLVDAFRAVALDNGTVPALQPFRFMDCLNDVLLSLGEQLSADRIELRIICAPDLQVLGLASDWATVLDNLINNSLRHGFKGRQHGVIEIRVVKEPTRLRVTYSDDGNGMSPESLARVFDPFYTSDHQHGMGLGMSLVHNVIAQRMHGSIQCESQPQQGVHFHIDLPQ